MYSSNEFVRWTFHRPGINKSFAFPESVHASARKVFTLAQYLCAIPGPLLVIKQVLLFTGCYFLETA